MHESSSMASWPVAERPRERLLAQGAEGLTDAELVAILLGNGRRGQSAVSLAQDLIAATGLSGLGKCAPAVLSARPGIGPAKAARLLAACEIGRRRERTSNRARATITTPADVARLAGSRIRDQGMECLLAIFLDAKHRVLQETILFRGCLEQTAIYPGEVFRAALMASAAAFVLAHNHPSGDPTPSRTDIELTAQLQQGARLLGLRFLDHVIIGDGHYRSLLAGGPPAAPSEDSGAAARSDGRRHCRSRRERYAAGASPAQAPRTDVHPGMK
jgi:DNA repair protein RadC